MIEPCADHRGRFRLRRFRGPNRGRNIEKWREAENIVAPEDCLELSEVGFLEVSAFVHRAIINASDLQRQRVRLRRDDQVRAEGAKFTRQPVAYFERDRQRSSRDGHAHD